MCGIWGTLWKLNVGCQIIWMALVQTEEKNILGYMYVILLKKIILLSVEKILKKNFNLHKRDYACFSHFQCKFLSVTINHR